MKLFWYPNTRAARALWMLEETGLEYEPVLINLRDPAAKENPDFLAASPMGKVPALTDGDARMADSAAICLYVADRYATEFAPATDDPRRATFLFWMFYGSGAMEPAMAQKMGGWESNRQAHGWGDYELMIETLENGLKDKEWLLGEQFTAADVMVGSTANFMRLFGIMPDGSQINAYVDRCLARPAYQRALAMNAETQA
ncbi:MAG: glutathione S-transferase family protein [Gammaproteobacteria bacterium]